MSGKVFEKYSNYYDLLYEDKEYHIETDYVYSLIHENLNKSRLSSILDLGCGTGKHDFIFAKKGIEVTGVDLSESMIDIAKKSLQSQQNTTDFHIGDVRNIRLNKTFNVVISLFHVASYQITNSDILGFFKTAYSHLNSDGIFIFGMVPLFYPIDLVAVSRSWKIKKLKLVG
jgi:2-polyprenyl-3-methyl-5-hydroxy-6-metoxy-1,4-benzoquinol methylase